ncbi:Putative flippase GtrA (transmembrane translocase of bactoprenol-linked glucose) [Cnuella takakiae]|uniref:Putative flippase GtrA (Transmembrane translocase of bactoprenol-linked glucose) n=1 Tax=Cnuella takakiae TaxID=1302690 RepID=A0A1M4V5G9_9BACT|nr:GtrA family protein [Cnuella takakiae]OLY92702.1 phenylalanine 4-monooxygenase [Cnuella takakiae]SHE64179.1 Putative flippase GtrA (transmembrane translocase of bactoprenol-linked glucose) [Cnuella takakiae]
MRRLHHFAKGTILNTVDFFYPLCRPFMPLQTFRYAACGGGNTAFNILLYFILYNFVLDKMVLHLGPIAISAHIAAFLIAFCITFPTGFYLSMFVVFSGSHLRRRTQFLRYFLVAIACILINYVLLKLFVDVLGWYPTPSMILTTAFVIVFSYLSQRHFSFQKKVAPATANLSEVA